MGRVEQFVAKTAKRLVLLAPRIGVFVNGAARTVEFEKITDHEFLSSYDETSNP